MRHRLLLVDPDETLRARAALHLRWSGHSVAEATSAVGALDLLRRNRRFDAIVASQYMPDLGGLGLRRLLLGMGGEQARLPFILTSSIVDADRDELADLLGVCGILARPYDGPALYRAVCAVRRAVPKIIPAGTAA